VSWIQAPLKQALEQHFIEKALADLRREYPSAGEVSPEIVDFIKSNRMVFEKVYVEAGEVSRVEGAVHDHRAPAAETQAPRPNLEAWSDQHAPLPNRPDLIVTRVWRPIQTVVKALNAYEAFMIWLKAAFVTGLVIASPYIFLQLWSFVAAGLYPHEKRYVHIYLPFSLILFLAGAALAFFFVFQYILGFLFSFNRSMNIDPDPRISEWLGFVLLMPIGFGAAFQLPLVMLFLHRIGIFTLKAYLDKWRIAILVIFVADMILTPSPDPVSMLLMALPLTGLYFLGIGLCKWMPRQTSPYGEVYEP
jgi:sec-independent protein translocase protein TatC